ncbi:diguanylate cyclase [Tardiphaga sp. vice352]|uniref:sensor domain-containing diguanylate cyclase n=1 Tax=unclassified Tardiphaga TaxID=2631404 RepID=UPI00116472DE|nr:MULTISPECIES: diguanylate cyclase [unclassified Tardiphaga]QDM18261.1 diguanylate cyclase [Tardiphaga sp. vice278]QDM23266.1 diguanylate cyclase [Tardiphaga sp. vice154]QDM28487.1 diguanylate cyclase [Tardiphaga sp. vice304]QDM33584.1 diguanylate cyclase [Tardiphaga sp. vice352]
MSFPIDPDTDAKMFELAPVSLWIEDYSDVKALFEQWQAQGVDDIGTYLLANPARVQECSQRIRILRVNRKTLSLFGARDLNHLMVSLSLVMRDDTFKSHVSELAQLWSGQTQFSSHTVNYTLAGDRLDIQLHGTVLPGHEARWDRVMIAIEDVTEREGARRRLAKSEDYAFGLFAHSPVSLWVEDFSGVKRLIDEVRERGVEDFRVFTDVHEEFVSRCMSEIRVLDVNARTLELFGAPDKETLLRNLGDVFRDEMGPHFREQLIDLWNGKLFQQREVVNYALDGTKLHLLLQFSVLPNHERDWSRVQVALTDITARKKAEAYLEYLGTHDVLTRTLNRSFYVDELNRLERRGQQPVTIIIADLNGLKTANDELGHAVGDALLRRAGEVFGSLVEKPATVARIGGDEFAVLLPGTDAAGGEAVLASLAELIEVNNQYYPDLELSVSTGISTSRPGERLEQVVKRADMLMLQAKRLYYIQTDRDRRSAGAH